MATYEIPAEPTTDRVWLLDSKEYGPEPLLVERDRRIGGWTLHRPVDGPVNYDWFVLLTHGTVSDVDPDDVSWLPPGPWESDDHAVVRDRHGTTLLLGGNNGERSRRLAALVARLVNEHVARRAGGAS